MPRFLDTTENTQVSVPVPTSLALQLPSAKEQRSTGIAQAKSNPTGSLCASMLMLKNTTFAIAVMTNECKRLFVTPPTPTRSPFLLRRTRGTPKRQTRLSRAELLTLRGTRRANARGRNWIHRAPCLARTSACASLAETIAEQLKTATTIRAFCLARLQFILVSLWEELFITHLAISIIPRLCRLLRPVSGLTPTSSWF